MIPILISLMLCLAAGWAGEQQSASSRTLEGCRNGEAAACLAAGVPKPLAEDLARIFREKDSRKRADRQDSFRKKLTGAPMDTAVLCFRLGFYSPELAQGIGEARLAEIALADPDAAARKWAVRWINDTAVVEKVSVSDKDPEVRLVAVARSLKLLQGSGTTVRRVGGTTLIQGASTDLPTDPDLKMIAREPEVLADLVRTGDLAGVEIASTKGAPVNARHRERGDLLALFAPPRYEKRGFNGMLGVGWTPLFWAAHEGHFDIAGYLIAQGATVDLRDQAGATPVMFAVWANKPAVVKLLLEHGAATTEPKYGMTLLMLAAALRQANVNDCLAVLLAARIPIDAKDADGWTALHHSAWSPQKTAFLLERGADPNQATNDGLTPLMLAAGNSQPEVVRDLLTQKPNINVQDKAGQSALAYAIQNCDYDTVKLLLEVGADTSLRNREGKPAQDLAKEALDVEQRLAIKTKEMGEDSVLVTEGFLYAKNERFAARLSVSGAEDGLIRASGTTAMSFDGRQTSDGVGSHWTFEKPNITFRNGGYAYTSKYEGATIDFREDGVVLRGFTWRHEKLERHKEILDLVSAHTKR